LIDEGSLKKGKGNLEPVFASSETGSGQKDNFFLRTNILNKKQKDAFNSSFRNIT